VSGIPPQTSVPSQDLFLICMRLNEPIVESSPEQRSPHQDSCHDDSMTATARSRFSSTPHRQAAQENTSVVVPVNCPWTSGTRAEHAAQSGFSAAGPQT
jgi:hypothetical protein